MKNLDAPLIAHLATGGPFLMCDLYTITLTSGTVLRWADYDVDVPSGGFTFSSSGPALKRGRTRIVLGVEVDTLDVSIYPDSTDMVDGLTITAAASAGSFDGATLKLERAFLAAPATVIGTAIMFTGRFADLTASRTEVAVRVNSFTEALATQLPRNLYQASCVHTLYGADCTVSRAAFGVGSTVAGGGTRQLINCGLANTAGWFDRGYLLMTSGTMAGTRRTIKSYSPGAINLLSPLPATPAVGDTFTAYPGCNRSSDCAATFANLPNFRATPYIPVPETAI
jgi:uncharacterized phage protein (TIGR02218 family)